MLPATPPHPAHTSFADCGGVRQLAPGAAAGGTVAGSAAGAGQRSRHLYDQAAAHAGKEQRPACLGYRTRLQPSYAAGIVMTALRIMATRQLPHACTHATHLRLVEADCLLTARRLLRGCPQTAHHLPHQNLSAGGRRALCAGAVRGAHQPTGPGPGAAARAEQAAGQNDAGKATGLRLAQGVATVVLPLMQRCWPE